MTDPKRVVKKVRRIRKVNVRDTSKDWLVELIAERSSEKKWRGANKIKRDQNFKKALAALEVVKEQKLAEKERQQGIMETRLKNLKKARKAKKKYARP